MRTRWTWCCCDCPTCPACKGGEGPEIIWTHTNGLTGACQSHNRNLEMPYWGRQNNACVYAVEGENPDTDSAFRIDATGFARFESRVATTPDLDFRYPDCSGGTQADLDCIHWNDDGASWACCTGTCDCTNAELQVLGVSPQTILDNEEGEILDESGNPIQGIIVSECGETPFPPSTCGGCLIDTAPPQMQVVIQNFQNKANMWGTGLYCDEANGTWEVDTVAPFGTYQCRWRVEIPSPDPPTIFNGWIELVIEYERFVARQLYYQVRVFTPAADLIGGTNNFAVTLDDVDRPDCRTIQDLELFDIGPAPAPESQCELATARLWISSIIP